MKRLAGIFLSFALLFVSLVSVNAQATKSQQQKRAKIEKEMRLINAELDKNSKNSSNALNTLNLIQKKIRNRQALIDDTERQIREIQDSINVSENLLQELNDSLAILESNYKSLVKVAYRTRNSRTWFMSIFSSPSPDVAVRRFAYLRKFSEMIGESAQNVTDMRLSIESEQDKLLKMKEALEAEKLTRKNDLELLKKDEQSSRELISQLKKDRKSYEAQLSRKKKEMDALNEEIAKMIRKASESGKSGKVSSGKKKGGKKTSTEVDDKLGKSFSGNKGKLPWPVEGTVIDSYGQHYHPLDKSVKLPFNNGVTVSAQKDAQVKAIFDGTVSQVVVMPGYAQCVLIKHGNYFTFYCKLKDVKVKAGDKIKTGQIIGNVETINGESQFHFQLWSGNSPQNPENWLR